MDWLRQKDNPWFARSFVNRVWAGYFNVGIVEPTDEFTPSNPPSNPELLNWLTEQFIKSDYDMKWLHRQITSSQTYQRSWRPNETNAEDPKSKQGHKDVSVSAESLATGCDCPRRRGCDSCLERRKGASDRP